MKVFLLITGILFSAVFVICLFFGALNMHAFRNLYDGTPSHYRRLRKRAKTFFCTSAAAAVIGTVCIVISRI
ncbi:MAG: hypothetical protein E7570_01455 [Ruminococcaceae bacterium]|nr:hypothetical protein [Oscillospiraceae bacterium]